MDSEQFELSIGKERSFEVRAELRSFSRPRTRAPCCC